MKSKLTHLLLFVLFSFGLWNCEDLPPTEEGGATVRALISGVVTDINTSIPIFNATIIYNIDGRIDSTTTDANGSFKFEVDLTNVGSSSVTVTVKKRGYQDGQATLTVTSDNSLSFRILPDLSTSAGIKGVVRDSVTRFPLRNSVVLFAVPGFVDSVVTSIDGAFTFIVDLIDQNTLPVVVTVSKTGFKTKQNTYVVTKGQTTDLDSVFMQVDRGSTVGQIVGRVFDAQSRQPIFNATVLLISSLITDSSLTAGDGSYSFSIDLQGLSSLGGTLKVSKSGYRSRDLNFNVAAGSTAYYDVFLDRDTTTGIIRDSAGTGSARSIALISVSPREISVYGVGGAETSILIWEVRDSLGFPIDIDHRDTVFFELVGIPVLGGAYISPAWALTNVAGRVATTVNSGTVSGVLQFVAKLHRESDDSTIQSTPVLITVHAGLPAQSHFTIGAAQFNFAGYDWLGRTNIITVQVGDKYSNPVKINTAVYFNTTGGVVTASGFTDPTSHASVTLYSGNPLPRLPALGAFPALYGDGTGYCYVRSFTLGEGGVNVSDSILILMSARTQISIDTFFTNLHVDSGECVDVPITISDRFGNPLAPGTRVITELEFSPPEFTNWSVTASGLPEDPLDDYLTRGPGSTSFTLRVCDGTVGGTPETMPFVVTIRVTGPNGNAFVTITGDVGPP